MDRQNLYGQSKTTRGKNVKEPTDVAEFDRAMESLETENDRHP